MSKGEDRIVTILSKNKVSFCRELSVNGLHGKHNTPLRYDFGIYKNNQLIAIIEFDGEQHFQANSYFHKTKSSFYYRCGCDRKKNEWALRHQIPLYRIPYWELDNLFTLKDLFRNEFLVKTIYHNDELIRNLFGGK